MERAGKINIDDIISEDDDIREENFAKHVIEANELELSREVGIDPVFTEMLVVFYVVSLLKLTLFCFQSMNPKRTGP